ncbi:hypothetical protein KM043_012920 [Ampulex compressa]|nr:hypothetical protein KM043_012920 [Ampulex compressa]
MPLRQHPLPALACKRDDLFIKPPRGVRAPLRKERKIADVARERLAIRNVDRWSAKWDIRGGKGFSSLSIDATIRSPPREARSEKSRGEREEREGVLRYSEVRHADSRKDSLCANRQCGEQRRREPMRRPIKIHGRSWQFASFLGNASQQSTRWKMGGS